MYRQYRNLEYGEFLVVGGDTSQGGSDECYVQFLSKTKLDVPIVYQRKGVAAQMTAELFPMLERIHDLTGLPPTVAIERQNGGASEMERLSSLNRKAKFNLFTMPKIGQDVGYGESETNRLGWDTNMVTRPTMLGDLKQAIASKSLIVYDDTTIQQLFAFIINQQGKPEAAPGKHDDAVMALAVAWQLFLRVETPSLQVAEPIPAEQNDPHGLFAGLT